MVPTDADYGAGIMFVRLVELREIITYQSVVINHVAKVIKERGLL
jgi:hypothetical protein